MASHDDDTLDGGGRVCNVVVTAQTAGEDVVECLKPDDNKVYYLVEIWKGCERPIGNEENLQSVLLQWGSDLDDVTFVLKRKHASSRQNQKKKPAKSSRDSPVDSQDHVHEKQLKVENMQRVLEEKEQYLKSLRANKVPLKNGLKINYVHRLELKVLEQEEQLGSMQTLEEDLFKYQVDNERLILELHRLRSLFAMKHQQLSEATERVEVLTKQLALQAPIQSDMNGNTVGVPGEEMPRVQEKNKAVQNSELQRQRNIVGQNDRQLESLKTHLSREQGPRLTEAQISRQNTNLLRSNAPIHTTKRSESVGDGGVFLGHVISKGRESCLDDDDENDTETSQDSGHVSVDSPSYQRGGMDPSFKFHSRNPPGRYIEKIECFDMDQEFGITTAASLNVIKDLHGSSVVDGLPYSSLSRSKNRSVKNIVSHACNPNGSQPNCKAALSVQTDEKQCVLISAQFSQTQSKLDSPQLTLSSRSSMASQLSDAEMRSDEAKDTASRKTNAKEPLTYTTTTLTRKETKIDVRETSIDRTLGSISLYQRNKGDSPTEKDNVTPRATDSKVGAAGGDVKPDEKPKTALYRHPIQSAGVQNLSTRDAKPLQIQTRAEKDSGNLARASSPGLSRDVGQTVDGKQQKDAKLAPKPLPRKRTKTPPARGCSSDEVANIVVTSARTINEPSTSLPEHSTVDNDEPRGNTRADGFVDKKEANESGKSGEVQGSSERGRDGIRVGESSLKKETGKKKSGKRVSLDPHAVLLHASLEGELDLVKTIIHQVEDPSFPNTEGLTALHHAVCSSHDGIVKFLVGYGCDINASDMQGWTSLHCAAANNSMTLCEFLITRGACIFATTAIEGKTPSLCCEKDVQDFEDCLSYLLDSESNFGVTNDGVVYAVYGYQASRKDELSFECGERLTVIRRGDVTEKEWWWARDSRGQLGYIPRNLLALHPRIAPDV